MLLYCRIPQLQALLAYAVVKGKIEAGEWGGALAILDLIKCDLVWSDMSRMCPPPSPLCLLRFQLLREVMC